MSAMEYQQNLMQMGGIITEIQDGAVKFDLKGRLGYMKIPLRMLITDYELKIGQEIVFSMTMPEVLSAEPNEKYMVKSIE